MKFDDVNSMMICQSPKRRGKSRKNDLPHRPENFQHVIGNTGKLFLALCNQPQKQDITRVKELYLGLAWVSRGQLNTV